MSSKKVNMKSKKKILSPKLGLNFWSRKLSYWLHQEWHELIHELEQSGFGEWVVNSQGQDQVALYLETHPSGK